MPLLYCTHIDNGIAANSYSNDYRVLIHPLNQLQ